LSDLCYTSFPPSPHAVFCGVSDREWGADQEIRHIMTVNSHLQLEVALHVAYGQAVYTGAVDISIRLTVCIPHLLLSFTSHLILVRQSIGRRYVQRVS